MRVRATKACFVNSRLQAIGYEFEVTDDLFSESCMERMEEPAKEESDAPKRRGRPPRVESER